MTDAADDVILVKIQHVITMCVCSYKITPNPTISHPLPTV